MKSFFRIAAAAIVILVPAAAAMSQEKTKSSGDAAMAKDLENAMTPGQGQKKLDFLVGTFDVKIRSWATPTDPPSEDAGVMIGSWVLGGRYTQMMLAGTIAGEPYNGIGYAGFDNTTKKYMVTFMDSASTGMEWYEGGFEAAGKKATLKGSTANPVTGKSTPLEMRLTLDDAGNHVNEFWGMGMGDKIFKLLELTYIKRKS